MRQAGDGQSHKSWLEPVSIILAALIVATALFLSRADEDRGVTPAAVQVPGLLPEGVPFTPAVRAGGLIFLSGQVGIEPGTFELVDGGVEAEARQTMENIGQVLVAAGAGYEDIVKCTVFLQDIGDWAAFNEIYGDFFPGGPPARSAFAASGLVLDAAAEVDCIAAVPDDD